MCELMGMSALKPVDVNMSFADFARHGGWGGRLADGWGLVSYLGRDVRLLREPEAAVGSPWVQLVSQLELHSQVLMAHVRHATVGTNQLANTQPFRRELGGRVHSFIHNGHLPELPPLEGPRSFLPVGDTDSEHAFCLLMNRMAPLHEGGRLPSLDERWDVLMDFAARTRALGLMNFLYTDSDLLFAHSHYRIPPGVEKATGLWQLERSCAISGARFETSGLRVGSSAMQNQVVVLASVPLSDESWSPLPEGSLLAIKDGEVVRSHIPDTPDHADSRLKAGAKPVKGTLSC